MQRAQRLRSAADFQRVRARRRSWAHPLLVLYVDDSPVGVSRAGFIVGRRVGKAVVRNRVKRRLREAMRARYAALVRPVDLVWVARPGSGAADFWTLDAAVEQLLRAARLLPRGPAATAPVAAAPPAPPA
jgi:ribonuclease P protein component